MRASACIRTRPTIRATSTSCVSYSGTRLSSRSGCLGSTSTIWRARSSRTPRRCSTCEPGRVPGARREPFAEPGLPGRERKAARGVSLRPKKSLGQHFLVDDNILDVIGRLAELEPTDVVFEVGPGLGVLTRYLSERVAFIHAAEVDRRLWAHLDGIANTEVHWGDALRLDISALDPPPAKLVSNL